MVMVNHRDKEGQTHSILEEALLRVTDDISGSEISSE
jgi:hypothetical protein